MNETSLSRLHDIVIPPPVPFWPPAPGWYVITALLLAAAVALAWWGIRRYRRNAYRRAALRELHLISRAAGDNGLAQLPALLKRTALAAWPRAEVASLSGEHWCRFLARSAGLAWSGQAMSEHAWASSLVRLGFEGRPQVKPAEQEELLQFAELWIRRHKVTAG